MEELSLFLYFPQAGEFLKAVYLSICLYPKNARKNKWSISHVTPKKSGQCLLFAVCPFLPQTSMSNKMLTIVCVVHGEDRPFSIKIESGELVSELKNQLRAMTPAWNHLAAKDLDLWKISIPYGDERLKSIKLDGSDTDVEAMIPVFLLSDYFSGDNDLVMRNIHVLVQLPVASELYCLSMLPSTDDSSPDSTKAPLERG
jgi:hypothetical protein